MTTRLYYEDSFLTDFEANVTEIQELSRANGQSLWRVALDRTAFYPTSGGQPHDTGRLIATARSGAELTAEILVVEEDDHGEVWHHTAKPLLPGTAVRGIVDRGRRLDHIQQHSGQHLLSAAFLIANAPTVSFHLGEAVSTIDLTTEKLPEEILRQAEALCNEVIAENLPVAVTTVSRAQAEAWLASGDLRKLPSREGDLRVIEIGNREIGERAGEPFDRNACGGTHVRSTGQIGGLHLRGIEKVRDGWRVEFVCGLRAMQSARKDFRALTDAARKLSVSLAEVPDAIERLQTEARLHNKKIQAQQSELAAFRAAQLIRDTPESDGLRIVQLELSPPEVESAAEAKLLAGKVAAQAEKTMAIFAWRPAQRSEPATVIFARSSDLDCDCGSTLRQALSEHNGRGGGSKDMAQGSIAQEHLQSVMNNLTQKIQPEIDRSEQ